jgi:N-acylneuraminate cytidylyltransferase
MAAVNIAVIPARGGSQRIPHKNIREFCGQPIIAWPIEAALASGLFEQVVVSTDCPLIAETAVRFGAVVPFLRPASLADHHTPTMPVIRHAIEQLNQAGVHPELVCCIYATAPLLEPGDLLAAHDLLKNDTTLEFAFSVAGFGFPIFRALRIENGRTEMFWPEFEQTRSQDLPEAWHDAGQFYFGRTEAFLRRDGFFSARSAPVILPRHRVQDIDTEEDWMRAEALFRMQGCSL